MVRVGAPSDPSVGYHGVLNVLLVTAYWIWDEANYHKCYFKMEQRGGELLTRNLFPTFATRRIRSTLSVMSACY